MSDSDFDPVGYLFLGPQASDFSALSESWHGPFISRSIPNIAASREA